MLLPNDLIEMIEDAGYTVDYDDDGYSEFTALDFGKFSSAGQDFHCVVDVGDSFYSLIDNIRTRYNNFDVSEETYLWLDESGHGKNGAPYDMIDVYKDMEECRDFIFDLYTIIDNYVNKDKGV